MRKYFCFDFHKSKHKSKRAHTFSQLIAIMLAEIEARANTFTNVCANITAQTGWIEEKRVNILYLLSILLFGNDTLVSDKK